MYTEQALPMRCGDMTSSQYRVVNGIKQGGVLAPILCDNYTTNYDNECN